MKRDEPISTLWLTVSFIAWPFVAAALLAGAAVVCALAWLAIPFWNEIVGSIDETSEFNE